MGLTEPLSTSYGLTPREAQVAELIAMAYSRKRVARELGISPRTVETYTRRIDIKLTGGAEPTTNRAGRIMRFVLLAQRSAA